METITVVAPAVGIYQIGDDVVGNTNDNTPTIGDVYSIHVEGSMRWNGEYKVVGIDHHGLITVENVSTKERDEIRVEFLKTWPKSGIRFNDVVKFDTRYSGADCDCIDGCRGVSFSRCKLCVLRDFLAQYGA